ncbi:hypothetical protein LTR37_004965 [Vermiconidia calcicola]|uniref:Uncharacterized protein n=1 Tax=Vermiconidia calcicola TaxID=1690605 RepID=A0ACC3NL47_9PEZI|nr:hypothetical protein LTR37_004965 [Vermiconidia calcicola]
MDTGTYGILGFDQPVNAIPPLPVDGDGFRERCPNAITDWGGRPLTLREKAMMSMLAEVMDKPDWQQKVHDEETVAKWRLEVVSEERDFSGPMFEFCIKELRDNAEMLKSTGIVPAIAASAVVYGSDSLISIELRNELKAAVTPLEDAPAAEKDWHPGSNNQVLDLVHPSLFPLVYGRTRLMTDDEVPMEDVVYYCGKGEIAPVPQTKHLQCRIACAAGPDDGHGMYSARFQWLPCDVEVGEDANVRIASYINNLHPEKHSKLYRVIEAVVSKAIPVWDLALTEIFKQERTSDSLSSSDTTHGYYPPRVAVTGLPEWKVDRPIVPEGEDEEEVFESILDIEYGVNWERSGLMMPEPSEDTHIEGQLNEHICASALLYYDNVNITDSYLAFRERVDAEAFAWGSKDKDDDPGYEQFEYDHMEQLFGVSSHQTHAIQDLGRVRTDEGRLVVFPNVLQHRVEPFNLVDPSKPGHRKILALFLVDPYIRIPSTSDVPPQQKDWWAEMVQGLDRVGKLPPELFNNILEQAGDVPISLEEAKELRLELMAERSTYVDEVNKDYEHYTLNFCEH